MDGRVQYSGLGTFSRKRLATLGYSVLNSRVYLACCVWTIILYKTGSFDNVNNLNLIIIYLVIISVIEVVGQAIGFYAIALNHRLATFVFMCCTSSNFALLALLAALLTPIFWCGEVLNLAGLIIIMLYYLELKKAQREQMLLNSSASGY